MIRYLNHHEIDFDKWDACVSNSETHSPYGISDYLNITCPKFEALVLNDYEVVMPLTCSTKLGIHYLYQPYFTQQLGLFGNHISDKLVSDFLIDVPKKFKLIDIQIRNSITSSLIDLKISNRMNCTINLNISWEQLFSNLKSRRQREYKKAVSANYLLAESDDIEKLIFEFKKTLVFKNNPLKPKHLSILKNLLNANSNKFEARIFNVSDHQKKILATMICVFTKKSITNILNFRNEQTANNGATTFLIADILKSNADKPLVFDFEGSSIAGVASFYQSFGAEVWQYKRVFANRLPVGIKKLV